MPGRSHTHHQLKTTVIVLLCLMSAEILQRGFSAETATNATRRPKYSPLVSVPPMFSPANTKTVYTNAHDPYEGWLMRAVDDTKQQLQQTNLNVNYRQSLEWLLRLNQEKLTNYEVHIQKQNAFFKSVQSNARTAWTNMPDPIGDGLASDVAKYEAELADPGLTPKQRKSYEAMLENYKQKLDEHQKNAQLWANLRLAEQNKNGEQIAVAQRQLADFLAGQLGQIQGKTYPAGMSLDAIMAEYRKQAGGSSWIDNRTALRTVLYAVLILPPLIVIGVILRGRFRRPK